MGENEKIDPAQSTNGLSSKEKANEIRDVFFPAQKEISGLTETEKKYIKYFLSNWSNNILMHIGLSSCAIALLISGYFFIEMGLFKIIFFLGVLIGCCILLMLIYGDFRRKRIYIEYQAKMDMSDK
jgi:hypothetical protein